MAEKHQEPIVHLVDDKEELDGEASSNYDHATKLHNDILYFLEIAGVAKSWNSRLQRIRGSDEEDQAEKSRKIDEFVAYCEKKRDQQQQQPFRPSKKAKTNPHPQRGPYQIELEPVDVNDKSAWSNIPRFQLCEEEADLRQAHDVALQASTELCTLEHTEKAERQRRKCRLAKIYCNAAAEIRYFRHVTH